MEISNISVSSLLSDSSSAYSSEDSSSLEEQLAEIQSMTEQDMSNISLSLSVSSMIASADLQNYDNITAQNTLADFFSGDTTEDGFSLASIGYEGTPLSELTSEEASELISDTGYFGVTNTSERVSSFVIGLVGNDAEALQQVREGLVTGFEEAEAMWGGTLPDISYETQEQTLSIVDAKIAELLNATDDETV